MGLLFCDDAPMNSNYVPLNTYISIDSEEINVYEELNMNINSHHYQLFLCTQTISRHLKN
jgi:hypothetical protein